MAKKNDYTFIIIVGVIILVIMFASKSDFSFNFGDFLQNFNIAGSNNSNNLGSACSITIYPLSIISGGSATGTIIAQPNTICIVYMSQGSGYNELMRQPTNSAGVLSSTQTINQIGTYSFYADCGDCQTNKASLKVLANPGQDSDGDGYNDQEEINAGTDPYNPASHPIQGGSCNNLCINNGYKSGIGPVDSPGRCNYPEVYYTDNYGTSCCCTPKTFCDTMCYNLGFNGARQVNSLSECTASESQKQQGNQYCCCSLPPTNAADCILAAQRFGSTTGLFPVSSWSECASQADSYCKSINKQWSIYALIDLSQCCGVTCS